MDILTQNFLIENGKKSIKMGERIIEYNDSFQFFITTKLSNPHYPPEICVKVYDNKLGQHTELYGNS